MIPFAPPETSPRAPAPPRVLARRVSARPRARLFDVGVGVLLPIWLLGLDRVLFPDEGILGRWMPAAYAGTAGFVLALTSWLAFGSPPSLLSGVLAAGALFALSVGVALLPWSILGILFLGLGLLGLTPFAMVYVYFSCTREAWKSGDGRFTLGVAGFVLGTLPPLGAQLATDRAAEHALVLVVSDEIDQRQQGIETLRWLRFVRGPRDIVIAYSAAETPMQGERLAEAYRGVTGLDIETAFACD
jgi:hypothetical protein